MPAFENLKQVSIDMPINRLNVICGVSGSGKSSLARGVLLDGVKNAIAKSSRKVQSEKELFITETSLGNQSKLIKNRLAKRLDPRLLLISEFGIE